MNISRIHLPNACTKLSHPQLRRQGREPGSRVGALGPRGRSPLSLNSASQLQSILPGASAVTLEFTSLQSSGSWQVLPTGGQSGTGEWWAMCPLPLVHSTPAALSVPWVSLLFLHVSPTRINGSFSSGSGTCYEACPGFNFCISQCSLPPDCLFFFFFLNTRSFLVTKVHLELRASLLTQSPKHVTSHSPFSPHFFEF